jgi:hypothetical protein
MRFARVARSGASPAASRELQTAGSISEIVAAKLL